VSLLAAPRYEVLNQKGAATVKRIFILSRQTMFGQGIEALLSTEDEIELINPANDIETAAQYIQSSHPDIIILNCDEPEPDITPAVLCVLREKIGISVIGISLQDNSICVLRGERKEVRQLEDLFEAIYAEK
jgi:DNA-binding NarL/FixJ family response regulator